MKSLMDLQSACSRVTLVAARVVADKWLLSRVSQLVRLEVALSDKLLVAVSAAEGSFSSVSSHMSLEVSSFGEFFQTCLIWTNENFLLIFWPLELLNHGYIFITTTTIKSYNG